MWCVKAIPRFEKESWQTSQDRAMDPKWERNVNRLEDLRKFPYCVVAHVSIFAVVRDEIGPEDPARTI